MVRVSELLNFVRKSKLGVASSENVNKISKRTRWTVLRLEGEGTTKDLYDRLWKALGKQGKRWLSVAKHNGVLRALLYKGDDGEVDLARWPSK